MRPVGDEPYGTPAPRGAGQWAATAGAADVANGQLGFAAGYRSTGGLYHFGQRYYDAGLMRWTQPDPLDQAGDLREGNRYLYVGADPVNMTDPHGLCREDLEGTAGTPAQGQTGECGKQPNTGRRKGGRDTSSADSETGCRTTAAIAAGAVGVATAGVAGTAVGIAGNVACTRIAKKWPN